MESTTTGAGAARASPAQRESSRSNASHRIDVRSLEAPYHDRPSAEGPRYTPVTMRSIALLAALLAAVPAQAILVRADRDDTEYVELATRYPSSIALAPGIEGVLIAPRWVL